MQEPTTALYEAKRLKRHMQSLPQFAGVTIAVFGSHDAGNRWHGNNWGTQIAYIILSGWCAEHEILVEWKHNAEIGRWVYVVNRHLKVFDQESLVQIVHRDMLMNRMGIHTHDND